MVSAQLVLYVLLLTWSGTENSKHNMPSVNSLRGNQETKNDNGHLFCPFED